MSKKVNMNVFLHFLLVIKQMNNFTVVEARDVLLHEQSEFNDAVETRKFIYRQLTRNVEKGLLKRSNESDNGNKEVIYSKTALFFTVEIKSVLRGNKPKRAKVYNKTSSGSRKVIKAICYQEELQKELLSYEIDFNTVLEEAKEYKRLSLYYPELYEKLKQHHTQAKKKSIKLLGKINALQTLLDNKITKKQPH